MPSCTFLFFSLSHCSPLSTVGLVCIHVPLSLSDLSQIEKRLGSFVSDPAIYPKEFFYITQAYNLTWHDTYVLSSPLPAP
jgi:hypothetical protein